MNEAEPVLANDDVAQEVRISGHALERFMSRHKKITGESLTIEQAFAKIRQLLAAASLESDEENPKIAKRREENGACQYFINSPWRFVLRDNALITCEIFPEFLEQIPVPKILTENRRCRIIAAIEENPVENYTVIMKSWPDAVGKGLPWSVVQFPEIVEINAVIRALKTIGIGVDYDKLRQGGEKERKSCFLAITIPKEIVPYEIKEMPSFPRLIKITLGLDNLLPRGQRYVLCVGVTKRRIEQTLAFLLNKEWLKGMEDLVAPAFRLAGFRYSINDKTPVKQRLDAIGELRVSYLQDSKSRSTIADMIWQGEGQLVFHNGGCVLSSDVCKGRTKKEVNRKICDGFWERIVRMELPLDSRAAAFHRLLRIRHIQPEEDDDEIGALRLAPQNAGLAQDDKGEKAGVQTDDE